MRLCPGSVVTLGMSEQWRTRRVPARSSLRSLHGHGPTLTVKNGGHGGMPRSSLDRVSATTRIHDSRDLYRSQGKIARLYISALSCGTLDAASLQNAPQRLMEISVRLAIDINYPTKSNPYRASARDLMLSTNRCKVFGKGGKST